MLTFTLADGRTAQAESLADFVDQHFDRNVPVDAVWAGNAHFADGTILDLAPAGQPHASLAVARIEGEGFNIGGSESARAGLTHITDPLGINGPVDNALVDAFLNSSTSIAPDAASATLRHIGTPDVWAVQPADAAQTSRPLARRFTADTPLIEKLQAGGALADHPRLQQRLDASLPTPHLDPAPKPHVGRQL